MHIKYTNTGADYFGIWPFISTKLTFVPNQPNRRIPCAKPVLFHNFFFENSKKPLNRKIVILNSKKPLQSDFFEKKIAAWPQAVPMVSLDSAKTSSVPRTSRKRAI